jgi:hypothetical protein
MTTIVDADRFRSESSARGTGGSDGGDMEGVLPARCVESLLGEGCADANAIKATLLRLVAYADIPATKTGICEFIGGYHSAQGEDRSLDCWHDHRVPMVPIDNVLRRVAPAAASAILVSPSIRTRAGPEYGALALADTL